MKCKISKIKQTNTLLIVYFSIAPLVDKNIFADEHYPSGYLLFVYCLDCNLAHLPLDLQEILIKKLDVRCKRKRSYGWKTVGEAFEIPNDDLRYLKLEYKRDTGSPTSKLLEILGITKKKTISDLVAVLRGPELRRPDISSIITLT